MRRALLTSLIFATGAAALANAHDETLADRFRAICDAVQAHHVEAPTRQQMVHAGIVAMYRAVEKAPPVGLGERISGLTTHEQFATLLAEVRPKPGGAAPTEAALDDAFLEGLSTSVPGGLTLMERKESEVAAQLAGNRYIGIQIAVSLDEATKLPKVMSAFEGGPAQRAGMKEGDLIEAVDGEDLGGRTLAEYIDMLRGEEGTPVTVVVGRAGEEEVRTFHLTREAMRHATISGPEGRQGFRLADTEPIGYLKIQRILASTPREVREAAAKMEAENLEGLIIDLRQASGGSGSSELHPAVLLADELLDSGTIGRVRLAAREVAYRAEPGSLFPGWPIAVLVDRATAGQAEWIAAALKENGRATIVGTTTAGLGASRSTVPVGDCGRAASLVTGLLEWPAGRPIGYFSPSNPYFPLMGEGMNDLPTRDARLGVSPDVDVPPARRAGAGEDKALKAALEILSNAVHRSETADSGDEEPAAASGGGGDR